MDDKTLNKYFGSLKVPDGTDTRNVITNFAMVIYDVLTNISYEHMSDLIFSIAAEYRIGLLGPPGEILDDSVYSDFIRCYRKAITDYGESQANVMLQKYLLDQLVHHSIYNSKNRVDKSLKMSFNAAATLTGLNIERNDKLELNLWDIPQDVREFINKQQPTDYMLMKAELMRKLATYWISERDYCNEYNDFTVPADLIWANTLPVKDMIIECGSSEARIRKINNVGMAVDVKNVRITQMHVPNIDDTNSYVCMLAIVSMADESKVVIPFGITNDGSDYHGNSISPSHNIGILKYGTVMSKAMFADPTCSTANMELFYDTVSDYIPVWYGIQVGLLNPTIEEVFKRHTNPKFAIVDNKKDRKGKTKTKIRYVKKLIMSEDVFDEALTHSYIRTKLCWYVTGHWRNQATKNGHKHIFIQGYWKGPLKDTKNADIRDREIVFPEKETDVYDNILDVFDE